MLSTRPFATWTILVPALINCYSIDYDKNTSTFNNSATYNLGDPCYPMSHFQFFDEYINFSYINLPKNIDLQVWIW